MNTVIQVVRAIQSSLLAFIATVTGQFRTLSEFLEALGGQMGSQTSAIMAQTDALSTYCAGQFTQIQQQITSLQQQLESMAAQLQTIINAVTVPPPAGITITISSLNQGDHMTKKALGATADIQILDDGSGNAQAVIGFVDDVGNPTVAPAGATITTTVTMSNPAITATLDSTSLIATLSPTPVPVGTPPALVTGVSFSASVTLVAGTTTLGPFTATGSTLLDIIAGGPAGLSIVES